MLYLRKVMDSNVRDYYLNFIKNSPLKATLRDNDTLLVKCNNYTLKINIFTEYLPQSNSRIIKLLKEWVSNVTK